MGILRNALQQTRPETIPVPEVIVMDIPFDPFFDVEFTAVWLEESEYRRMIAESEKFNYMHGAD